MNKSNIKIIAAFILVFICPCSSFAAIQLEKLKVAGYDVMDLDYIEVHEEDLIEVEKKVWELENSFCISIEGSVFPSMDVNKVYVSLNGGMGFWKAEGKEPFYFTFVPFDGATYPILIRFHDSEGEVVFETKLKIKYSARDWFKFFKDRVEKIRRAYEDKKLDEFMSYVDDSEFPYFSQFKKDLTETLEENNDLRLSLTVTNLDMSLESALVEVDWRKTFEDDSFQSGEKSNIIFKERREKWWVTSLSDETIFVVGKGDLYVIY